MMLHPQCPDVFNFQSLPDYLQAVYKFKKRHQSGFSYEQWAAQMGLKSRAYLRALIVGDKPLREDVLPLLLKGLELDDEGRSYFATLFRLQTAASPELEKIYLRDVFRSWTQNAKFLEPGQLTEFLSDPLVPVLFTYLSFDDGTFTVTAATKDLDASPERIVRSLRYLFASGIASGEISEDGLFTYRAESEFFKVASQPGSAVLKNFHLEGLKLSQAAADRPSTERKMFSSFFALSDEQFAKAQDLIRDFNQKIVTVFGEKSGAGKKIYRLNQQLVPVSRVISRAERET